MSEDVMLTVAEAAQRLRCNPATIRKLIVSGRMAAKDIGTGKKPEYRIPESEIAATRVNPVGRPVKPKE